MAWWAHLGSDHLDPSGHCRPRLLHVYYLVLHPILEPITSLEDEVHIGIFDRDPVKLWELIDDQGQKDLDLSPPFEGT